MTVCPTCRRPRGVLMPGAPRCPFDSGEACARAQTRRHDEDARLVRAMVQAARRCGGVAGGAR